jgi:ubiquinone/menaquinone biosynthesis C-methylase UbiE
MQTLYRKLSPYYKYFVNFHADTKKEIEVLNKLFKQHKVKSILDIACGIGRHSIALAKLGYDVTGVDFSSSQLAQARKDAKEAGVKVTFVKKDANYFTSHKKFDAIICMWSTLGEEPMQYEKVIPNVFRCLKKNGVFIIDNRDWSDIPKGGKRTIRNSLSTPHYKIKQLILDRFTEHFRIRDITYTINGKQYDDLCITHIIRPKEWVAELRQAGFRNNKIIKNYKSKKTSTLIVGQK